MDVCTEVWFFFALCVAYVCAVDFTCALALMYYFNELFMHNILCSVQDYLPTLQ
jgi:hypothetical protein